MNNFETIAVSLYYMHREKDSCKHAVCCTQTQFLNLRCSNEKGNHVTLTANSSTNQVAFTDT